MPGFQVDRSDSGGSDRLPDHVVCVVGAFERSAGGRSRLSALFAGEERAR